MIISLQLQLVISELRNRMYLWYLPKTFLLRKGHYRSGRILRKKSEGREKSRKSGTFESLIRVMKRKNHTAAHKSLIPDKADIFMSLTLSDTQ